MQPSVLNSLILACCIAGFTFQTGLAKEQVTTPEVWEFIADVVPVNPLADHPYLVHLLTGYTSFIGDNSVRKTSKFQARVEYQPRLGGFGRMSSPGNFYKATRPPAEYGTPVETDEGFKALGIPLRCSGCSTNAPWTCQLSQLNGSTVSTEYYMYGSLAKQLPNCTSLEVFSEIGNGHDNSTILGVVDFLGQLPANRQGFSKVERLPFRIIQLKTAPTSKVERYVEIHSHHADMPIISMDLVDNGTLLMIRRLPLSYQFGRMWVIETFPWTWPSGDGDQLIRLPLSETAPRFMNHIYAPTGSIVIQEQTEKDYCFGFRAGAGIADLPSKQLLFYEGPYKSVVSLDNYLHPLDGNVSAIEIPIAHHAVRPNSPLEDGWYKHAYDAIVWVDSLSMIAYFSGHRIWFHDKSIASLDLGRDFGLDTAREWRIDAAWYSRPEQTLYLFYGRKYSTYKLARKIANEIELTRIIRDRLISEDLMPYFKPPIDAVITFYSVTKQKVEWTSYFLRNGYFIAVPNDNSATIEKPLDWKANPKVLPMKFTLGPEGLISGLEYCRNLTQEGAIFSELDHVATIESFYAPWRPTYTNNLGVSSWIILWIFACIVLLILILLAAWFALKRYRARDDDDLNDRLSLDKSQNTSEAPTRMDHSTIPTAVRTEQSY